MKLYALYFDNYSDAMRALRKLKKRGVSLYTCILVVGAKHHNKVKDFLSMQRSFQRPPVLVALLGIGRSCSSTEPVLVLH